MTTEKQKKMGREILHECARYPMDVDRVHRLINEGADLNVQDDKGNTIVMRFIQRFSNPLVKRVLEAGADPTIRNNDNDTVLIVAARYGARWCLETLLEKTKDTDLDINAQSTNSDKYTALHGVIYADTNALVKPDFLLTRILLQATSPRMDIKDGCGYTADILLKYADGGIPFLVEIEEYKKEEERARVQAIKEYKERAHKKIDNVDKLQEPLKRKRLHLKRKQ